MSVSTRLQALRPARALRPLLATLVVAGALVAAPAALAITGPSWTMVRAEDPWVREAPPSAAAMAGYLTVVNPSKDDLTLVGATSPQFEEVQMHEIVTENGMTRMQQVMQLVAPAKGQLVFKPGSTHLMLMRPKKPLKAGDPVEVVLKWSPSGKTTVKMKVRPRNMPAASPAASPAAGGHEHH